MGQEIVCRLERIVDDLETGANPPGTIAPARVG